MKAVENPDQIELYRVKKCRHCDALLEEVAAQGYEKRQVFDVLPLRIRVVSVERADDKLYIPAIQQVSASLDEHGLLYVGDCKMASLGKRAFIQNSQDNYLCPLQIVEQHFIPFNFFPCLHLNVIGCLRLCPIATKT